MQDVRETFGLCEPNAQMDMALQMTEDRYRLISDLVNIRKERGLRQQDVADRMGISRVAVSRIESENRDPKLSTLHRYARAVGVVVTTNVTRVPDSHMIHEPAPSHQVQTWRPLKGHTESTESLPPSFVQAA